MKSYEQITKRQLLFARDIFGDLLSRKTKESHWQQFFAKYPFVLSTSLPFALRSDHIIPMARTGKSDPDFVFYPWDIDPIPYYGVIELKRPDSPILTVTRSNVAILTRDAQTAIEQSKVYVRDLGAQIQNANRSTLCLGNQSFIFVIMGLAEELSQKLGEKLYREQIEDQLPRNLQLLPYDTLFNRFNARIPAEVMILVPQIETASKADDIEEILAEIEEEERHYWESEKCG